MCELLLIILIKDERTSSSVISSKKLSNCEGLKATIPELALCQTIANN